MENLSYRVQSATGERHTQWRNHFFCLSLPLSPSLSVAQIHEMLLKDLHIGGYRRWRIDHTQPPRLITCFYEPILTIVRATSNPPDISSEIIPRMTSLPDSVKNLLLGRSADAAIHYRNQMVQIDCDGIANAWQPNVEDVFADDWRIVTM